MNRNIRYLVISGIMTAISVVLLQFASFRLDVALGGGYTLNIGFGVVPVIFSGLAFGPLYGAAVGGLADFLKAILFPSGAYFPGYTFSYAMMGLTPAVLMLLFRKSTKFFNKKDYPYIPMLISIAISQTLFSIILNTAWTSIVIGKGFIALLPPRVIAQVILIPVHTYILYIILNHKEIRRYIKV